MKLLISLLTCLLVAVNAAAQTITLNQPRKTLPYGTTTTQYVVPSKHWMRGGHATQSIVSPPNGNPSSETAVIESTNFASLMADKASNPPGKRWEIEGVPVGIVLSDFAINGAGGLNDYPQNVDSNAQGQPMKMHGVRLYANSPRVLNLRIFDCRGYGIWSAIGNTPASVIMPYDGFRNHFTNNSITRCFGGIYCEDGADWWIEGNEIHSYRDAGIYVADGAAAMNTVGNHLNGGYWGMYIGTGGENYSLHDQFDTCTIGLENHSGGTQIVSAVAKGCYHTAYDFYATTSLIGSKGQVPLWGSDPDSVDAEDPLSVAVKLRSSTHESELVGVRLTGPPGRAAGVIVDSDKNRLDFRYRGAGDNFGTAAQDVEDDEHYALVLGGRWDEAADVRPLGPVHQGSATAGSASTITLTGSASGTGNFYNTLRITTTSGTPSGHVGQSRLITAYDGTSKVATVSPNWTGTAPGAGTSYTIEEVAAGGTASTIVLNNLASSTDSFYNNMRITTTSDSSGHVGQSRTISSYTGSSRTATVSSNWTGTAPSAGTPYLIEYAITATAQAGSASSITLHAGASSTTNFYKGATVSTVTGGGHTGQERTITAYNETSKVATVSPDWTGTAPASGTAFTVTVHKWVQSGSAPSFNSGVVYAAGVKNAVKICGGIRNNHILLVCQHIESGIADRTRWDPTANSGVGGSVNVTVNTDNDFAVVNVDAGTYDPVVHHPK